MNILVIGSGGREHALCLKLYESDNSNNIYCNPGNPGIQQIAQNVQFDVNNEDLLISFCKDEKIKLVVVGPEQPLAMGIADKLRQNGINCFGPSEYASQLESSKSFAKEFMDEFNIPTASYKTFESKDLSDCFRYIENSDLPIVIKADGLAGGKGVYISNDKNEAKQIAEDFFEGKFGEASKKIVIEQFLDGVEASIFAICDGENFILLPPSQDYKRAKDGDLGLNTGGMGSFSPTPFVDYKILEDVKTKIVSQVLKGMKSRKNRFIGCLFVGIMIVNNKPFVIEFNVRFGDPETQSVLSLIEGDLAKLFYTASIGSLEKNCISIKKDKYACTVILASEGYPENFNKGFEIKGLQNNSSLKDRFIFHAGTKIENNKIVNSGGRVLGITAVANSLKEAKENAYNLAEGIDFENKYYRRDIADSAIK
ncbi:MAG: phosphoribosylamine--glycine ligase [Candidatus Kapaibacterium sp.]|nr:phosphoribosylamine--glycine ligase [Ignavibacteriota bacterium]